MLIVVYRGSGYFHGLVIYLMFLLFLHSSATHWHK